MKLLALGYQESKVTIQPAVPELWITLGALPAVSSYQSSHISTGGRIVISIEAGVLLRVLCVTDEPI